MAERNAVEQGKWADLLPDILKEIVKLNYCYDDYIRARAVCKQWNNALPNVPVHKANTNPWLVFPFNAKSLATQLAEKKIYHVKLPEMRKTKTCGSSFGWLTHVGIDGTLRLTNPFVPKVHFHLPPLYTLPHVISYNPHRLDEEYTLRGRGDDDWTCYNDSIQMQKTGIHKVILSCPPDDEKQDCMAIAIYDPSYFRLAFCRLGDDKWIDIPRFQETETDCRYDLRDAIFHDGKIYAIDISCRLFEYEFKFDTMTRRSIPVEVRGRISDVKPPPDHITDNITKIEYLIGCPDGCLLMVVRHLNFYHEQGMPKTFDSYNSKLFDIYKLNIKEEDVKPWSRVSNLRNCSLLIGSNSSILMPPASFSDNNGPLTGVNRVYYTDNTIHGQYSVEIGGHDIGVLNLDDGKINQLFPHLFLICPTLIWL